MSRRNSLDIQAPQPSYSTHVTATSYQSDVFLPQSLLQKRLTELGRGLSGLEGYSSAIALAKLFVDLGMDASGLKSASERPDLHQGGAQERYPSQGRPADGAGQPPEDPRDLTDGLGTRTLSSGATGLRRTCRRIIAISVAVRKRHRMRPIVAVCRQRRSGGA